MTTSTDRFAHLSPLKRALLALDELKARLDVAEHARTEPIAIVGLGCRFPGGADPAAFWRLLRDGRSAVREVPKDRWDIDEWYDPDPAAPGKMCTRSAAFLDRIDLFDAPFFAIAPREAASMDPQQRLFLEVCWEALEHAAIAPDSLAGSATGVYAGVASGDYGDLMKASGDAHMDGHFASGVAHSILSGRLAYILGLQGPALSVDTACSSSLVAVHLACQGLRQGDCRMAIAGGVNLMVTPDNSVLFSKTLMLAPDGRCKTFDASADGFVRGEGCGVLVLKRLSDATADGDRIVAIIRGSAVNQDGPSSGLTAPNGPAQEAVIREALRRAALQPADIDFVEAHGTGTSLGDPIEVQALGAVHAERPVERPLAIGSIKTNVGHLEAAAGVAGLIKLVLSLEHEAIPPHLHLQRPNTHVAWDELRVTVPTILTPWPRGARARIGAVSSFGFSGTNAHVIVEEGRPLPEETTAAARPLHILTLSARSDAALDARARDLLDALPQVGAPLPDLAYTENVGRAQFAHRLAFVAADQDELAAQLSAIVDGRAAAGARRGRARSSDRLRIAFLFTGQGAQYAGMGRELYGTYPEFRQTIDACDEILRAHLDRPLLSVLYPGAGEPSPIDDTAYTQPALFAIDYALAQLWRSWGIEPSVVMGHSLGEFVAACVAGVFSLEDGLALVASRGRLMEALPRDGDMASVFAPEQRVLAAIAPYADRVSVAAINDPGQTVISGERDAVGAILRSLAAENVKAKRLVVSHAFHSPLMAPMLSAFGQVLRGVSFSPPRCGFVSNVTGRLASAAEMCRPDYWQQHVMAPVRFAASVETVVALGVRGFIEAGPNPTLLGMAGRCVEGADISWLPSIRKERSDWAQLLDSVSNLYVRGAKLNWQGFDRAYGRRRIALPTYPFERERCWIAASPAGARTPRPVAVPPPFHPLLERRIRVQNHSADVFESTLTPGTHRWIFDHRVHGSVIVPGAAFIEMAFAAARATWGDGPHVVEALAIHRALVVDDERPTTIQVVVDAKQDGAATVRVFTVPDDHQSHQPWPIHAEARIIYGAAGEALPAVLGTLSESQQRCTTSFDPDVYYRSLESCGLELGPAFRGLVDIRTGEGAALAQVALPAAAGAEGYCLHPVLLDMAIQTLGGAVLARQTEHTGGSYVPLTIERARWNPGAGPAVWAQAAPRGDALAGSEFIVADVILRDAAGAAVAAIEGLRLKRADRDTLFPTGAHNTEGLYEIRWDPQPHGAEQGLGAELASPSAVASAMGARVSAIIVEQRLDRFEEALPHLEALAASYVVRAFRDLGATFHVGESLTLERLGPVVAPQRRLVDRLFDILGETGVLRREHEWVVARRPEDDDPAERLAAIDARYGEALSAELALVRRCGPRLADVLRGDADPLALLFPDGSAQLAEDLYQVSPAARAFNQMLAESVQRALAEVAVDRPVRVLEIGGGTGSTSSFLLPLLHADRTDYLFTDVSAAFTSRAAEKFSAYPFVRCQPLDIERDPASQGLGNERFDVIVAANVLHATRDLGETFAHVRQLLAPGGLLVLLEMVRPQRWIDLTFGLTEGWWRFTDRALRPSYPLLSLAGWREFLADVGFRDVAAVPGVEGGDVLGIETAFLARGPSTTSSSEATTGQWLVLADDGGEGRRLASALEAAGDECAVVTVGADAAETVRNAFATFREHGGRRKGMVHMWSLDAPAARADTLSGLRRAEALFCGSAVQLVQLAAGESDPVPVTLVTRGAQAVRAGSSADPLQAPLWGLGKVVALEHPELRCLRVDLDPETGSAAELAKEVLAAGSEDQVAFRAGQRYVARLAPRAADAGGLSGGKRPAVYRLEIPERGALDGLMLLPAVRRAPQAGEVEIAVRATALNFRDVLNVLGLYPGDPGPLGNECAGAVTAVGMGVAGLEVGDEVVGLAAGSFASHVTTSADFVVRRPATLDSDEAVTLPIAYVTAHFALHHLAKIKAGDRVLIHAAAGGVGLAAVHLARRAGAEVFATAGSAAKRAYLQSLGISQVMSSRTLDFSQEILARTEGRGVDIVLNSLAGDFIAATFDALRPAGCFLEIGKSGWTAERVDALGRNHTLHLIDWSREAAAQPKLIRAMLVCVMDLVAAGALPVLPRHLFTIDAAADAFRFMAQARHMGKIVVTHPEAPTGGLVRPDGSYLITGGLSGIGLLTATWLADRGATHLIVLGRRDPSDAARATVAELERRGVSLAIVRGDVAREQDVMAALSHAGGAKPPLRGIIHSAGVLDDGAILQQSWPRFETVMAPKVFGSWHLDRLTRDEPLDFFVMFSSVAAVFGSRGQSNHAAANTYLDALAHQRRAEGRPALSINWGVWSEIGAAVRHGVDKRTAGQGVRTIDPARGLATLERLMLDGSRQATVFPADWAKFAEQFGSGDRPPFLSLVLPRALPRSVAPRQAPVEEASAFLRLLEETPPDGRPRAVIAHVRAQAVHVLGLPASRPLDLRQPLSELGLDSLMAVELRNVLSVSIGRALPATLLFDYPTVEALGGYLGEHVLGLSTRGPAGDEIPEAPPNPGAGVVTVIEDLSDDEVDRLFAERIARKQS